MERAASTDRTTSIPPHLHWLSELSPVAREVLVRQAAAALAQRKLEMYTPYPRQREFHEAGATYRERLLMAASQVGKTWCAAAEAAMHLTGRYPDWWRGKAFHKPQMAMGASETSMLTRDGVQRLMFGPPAYPLGSGLVPKDAIVGDPVRSQHGVSEFYEHVVIRHGGGGDIQPGESVFFQRSYDQGRERVQAMTLDWVWMDEEPDEDWYLEALTRTNINLGLVMLTFTPMKGMSSVVKRYLLDKVPGTHVVQMDIKDAEHYTEEQRAAIIASYPEHEREARAHGLPVLGSGRVFTVPEEAVRFESFSIPQHWPRIVGLDFGFTHPTAAVWMAHDTDTDVVYIYDTYRVSKGLPQVHAAAIRSRGAWIPVAWPKDGDNETAAGPQLSQQYRDAGVNMLPEYAQFVPVSDRPDQNTVAMRTSLGAGVQMILTRMLEGRLKVAAHLHDWWEEFRLYHRSGGRIVNKLDDLISATRYALMCLDKAAIPPVAVKRLNPHRRVNWRTV